MISTALAIQDATRDAIFDNETVSMVKKIIESRNMLDEDALTRALFQYSAHLTALTATLVTSICLTSEQLDSMVDTIREFDQLEKDAN
jgi:NADPH-dependent 7-cyano-7-deazaguanine reductase QueF